MARIPPEIADLILGNTHITGVFGSSYRNKGALASCSLVCRSWRPFAQKRLFEELWLDIKLRPLDQFLALLESSPHIAAAIRFLCIHTFKPRSSADDDHASDTEDEPQMPQVSPVLLMKVAAQLSPRAHLKLETFTLLGWPSDTPLPTAPVRLHILGLFGLAFKPFKSLETASFDLASLFELDEIHFVGGRMLATTDVARILDVLVLPVATRPVARSVHFFGTDCFAACNIQCGGFDPEHMKKVVFSLRDIASLQFASMLLRLQGDGLRDVHLDVSYGLSDGLQVPSLWATLDIAACTHLESLRLEWHHMGTIPGAQDQDLNACERIATILASTPQTLHTLTFSLPYMQHPDTLGDTLRCLAPQVDQAVARFPGLRTITVRVTRSFAAEECMNVARGTLPMKLLDRGVLQIEHKPFHFCPQDPGE
ncbi:hypothetical protein TRAPUB_7019 [Trametes pubescens]|uniref:Uncharacterized protein n=1 Tax=Trametes pubescens TaxID=154538 RepID=A0A1M2V4C6_TRAPU|nr:hypothetical protein TRAPUB_7019 [Trametes pubescens]